MFYALVMTILSVWTAIGSYKIFGDGNTDVVLFVLLVIIIFILSTIRYNQ